MQEQIDVFEDLDIIFIIFYIKSRFCQPEQKKSARFARNKIQKIRKIMKNGKKGLTNPKKYAKIVNCIIIARTVGFLTISDKLYIGKVHKKAWTEKEKHSNSRSFPGRYQFFEWSD